MPTDQGRIADARQSRSPRTKNGKALSTLEIMTPSSQHAMASPVRSSSQSAHTKNRSLGLADKHFLPQDDQSKRMKVRSGRFKGQTPSRGSSANVNKGLHSASKSNERTGPRTEESFDDMLNDLLAKVDTDESLLSSNNAPRTRSIGDNVNRAGLGTKSRHQRRGDLGNRCRTRSSLSSKNSKVSQEADGSYYMGSYFSSCMAFWEQLLNLSGNKIPDGHSTEVANQGRVNRYMHRRFRNISIITALGFVGIQLATLLRHNMEQAAILRDDTRYEDGNQGRRRQSIEGVIGTSLQQNTSVQSRKGKGLAMREDEEQNIFDVSDDALQGDAKAVKLMKDQHDLITQMRLEIEQQREIIEGLNNDRVNENFAEKREQQALLTQMEVQMKQQREMIRGSRAQGENENENENEVMTTNNDQSEISMVLPKVSESGALEEDNEKEMVGVDLEGYKDAWDAHSDTDIPVFWHIPKAGGSTVKDILGTCHRFTMASEAGIAEGHHKDTEIAVVHLGGNAESGQDPSAFVNVDTTSIKGLERAKRLGLAQAGVTDVMITPFIFEAESLFDTDHRGRLFTVFRHPVDRAVSMHAYLGMATWEPTYNPALADMTVEEYAQSEYMEKNWMTRILSNQQDELTYENLQQAMDVVRRKILVGLLTEKEKTMERFEKYFGWKYTINPTNQESCREKLLMSGSNSNTKKEKIILEPGSKTYQMIAKLNEFDMQLFKYIERLFVEQESFVSSKPDNFRMKDASCCKCNDPPTC